MRFFKSLLLIIALLISGQTANAEVLNFFGEPDVFDTPLAYPRSSGDFAFSANTSKYYGQRVYYFEAVLGKNISLVTLDFEDLKFQLGAQASTWITLGYKNGAFPLITEDFLLAVPLSFRYKHFSGAISFEHISAHMGDGMNVLLEETLSSKEQKEYELYDDIAESEGMDLSLTSSKVYSRDFFSLYLSYEYNINEIESRVYGHAGYAHKMIPKKLGRAFVGTGFEAKLSLGKIIPYHSQDVTWNEDTDSVDYSYQTGIYLMPNEENYFIIRLATTGFIGYDRRGQMIGRKIKRFGLGLFIR